MQIKTLPAVYALQKKVTTNLAGLQEHVGQTPMQLMQQAEADGATIEGPQFWNYTGVDGEPETVFDLVIGIPVTDDEKPRSKEYANMAGYRCASATVKGSWSNLKAGYEKLMAEMAAQNMEPGTQCREIYHTVDFENPENCVTDIYIEIK